MMIDMSMVLSFLRKVNKKLIAVFLLVVNFVFAVYDSYAQKVDGDQQIGIALDAHSGAATGEGVTTGITYLGGLKQKIDGLLVTKQKMERWKNVYDSYKHMMQYIEVVSENIRLYEEVERMTKNAKEIIVLYTKYNVNYLQRLSEVKGVREGLREVTNQGYIYSLYDLDKYLTPAHIDYYNKGMENCLEHAQNCFSHMTTVLELSSVIGQLKSDEIKSANSDEKKKKIRMVDGERLNEVFFMDRELELCLCEMYNIIYQMNSVTMLRKRQAESYTDWKNVFDYSKYNYTWR